MISTRGPDIDGFLETPAWKQMAHCLAAADGEAKADDVPGACALPAGARFGPYEIVGFIGAGGMGEVYDARDTRLDRAVAIKRLPSAWASDPERLRLFQQEARSAAALTHTNVLAVYDVGTHDGCPYLVTERLEGETLRARLDRSALTTTEAVELGFQLANGLAAVHKHGIVHGDINPRNVFLTRDGTLKLLDFGLARFVAPAGLTGLKTILARADEIAAVRGTVGYIAPEQLSCGTVDNRVDIFSFGCVLYEMLTGTRAFRGNTAADTLSEIARPQPAEISYLDEGIPVAIRELVRRCLEKSPEARPASAQIAAALRALSTPAVRSIRPRALLVSFAVSVAMVVALAPLAKPRRNSAAPLKRWQASQAYEEYARGYALSHALHGGPDMLTAARVHYESSLKLQPGYPLALVGLADMEMMYFVRGFDPSLERIARAEALIAQALAAAPDSAEAYSALGSVRGWGRRDWPGAVNAFETAVRLDPSGKNWQGLAWALASLEPPRSTEAERAAREAVRLDPDYPYSYFQLARALRQQHRDDEAVVTLQDSLRIDPLFDVGYALLARIYLDRREWRRALAILDAVPAGVSPASPVPGERAVAAYSRQAYRSAAHAGLGEHDRVLAELEVALANGYRDWDFIDRTDAFATLRTTARFEQLLARYR